MDYFEDDDDDDWIFEVDLSEVGVKRKRDEASEEGEEGEMRGGALFEFDLTVGDMPRRWKNVVNKTRHTAQLRQTRDAGDGDLLGNEMTDAVRRALVSIVEKHPNLRPDDRIHFTMQSNAFAQKSNHCFQSTQFRVSGYEGQERKEASVLIVSSWHAFDATSSTTTTTYGHATPGLPRSHSSSSSSRSSWHVCKQ